MIKIIFVTYHINDITIMIMIIGLFQECDQPYRGMAVLLLIRRVFGNPGLNGLFCSKIYQCLNQNEV